MACKETDAIAASTTTDGDSVGDGYTYKHSVVKHPVSGDDVWMTKSVTEKLLATVRKDFRPRATDVFLCTYIKSGTTWVQAILREIIDIVENTDTRVEGVSVGLTESERIPWLEQMASIVGPNKWLSRLNSLPTARRRIFKTHCPHAIVRSWCTDGTKCIFVVRDPRDVVVSAWHHTRTKNFKYDGPFDHFAKKMFLKGRIECGDWFTFTSECDVAARSDRKNKLLLKYERMLKNPHCAVRKIASFIGVSLLDDQVSSVVANTSFDAMKRAEKSGGLRVPGWPHRKIKGSSGVGSAATPSKMHIRGGGSGKWKGYLDAETASVISKKFEKALGCGIDKYFSCD